MNVSFTHGELEQLDRYRLEHDLTYAALAAALHMNLHALYRLLRKRGSSKTRDRTRYKIQRFLAEHAKEIAS